MPFVGFLAFKQYTRVVAVILLLSKIIPIYSCYVLKGLVYIIIIALLGRQPFFYTKYTKLNMRSSCDIRLVSSTKYMFFIYPYILQSLQLFYLIYYRVSRVGYGCKVGKLILYSLWRLRPFTK